MDQKALNRGTLRDAGFGPPLKSILPVSTCALGAAEVAIIFALTGTERDSSILRRGPELPVVQSCFRPSGSKYPIFEDSGSKSH